MAQRDAANSARKFAVVSHVLPPLPSGQSVLLERLLGGLEADSYCLISVGQDVSASAGALPGERHQLRPSLRLPVLRIPLIFRALLILNALWGIVDRARQIAAIARRENCALLIGCTGDLYDLPATWLASRWSGRPFVAYIMDDYIFQWTGFQRRIAAWLEPRFLKAAGKVLVLNEFARISYGERYGIEPDVIHNPVRLPDLDRADGALPCSGGEAFTICYTGSIYHAHFDAFRNLVEVLKEYDGERVQLHIYTSQPRELLEQQGIAGAAVVWHPHIPQEEVFEVLRQADLLFLPLAFDCPIPEVIQTSAPFKTSEYLAAARPILVHAPADSFLSWYFRRNDCGMVVDRCDRQLLKEALDRLLTEDRLRQSLSAAARRRAEADFELGAIKERFLSLLKDAATETGVNRMRSSSRIENSAGGGR